jgi:hypothetical protein
LAWFKIDDGLHSSRKFLSIPRRYRFAAIGVWTVAGSWCADQLTDGVVPDYMLAEWNVPPAAPNALVDAGLWERTSDGYEFHKWHEYQPRKEDVDAERAASRERMRELRARRKQPKPQKDAEEPGVFGRTGANGSESVRNPDPTRPDPTPTSKEVGSASRGSRVTDPFPISDEMRSWAAGETPLVDLDKKTIEFVDYWAALPGQKGIKSDWLRTWKNGMRKQQEFAERDQAKKPPKPVGKIASNDEWMYR